MERRKRISLIINILFATKSRKPDRIYSLTEGESDRTELLGRLDLSDAHFIDQRFIISAPEYPSLRNSVGPLPWVLH